MQVAYATMSDYLQSESSMFCEDMSNYTLLQVLNSYQLFKRRTSPDFTIASVISNVRMLEWQNHVTIMPKQVTSQFYSLFRMQLEDSGLLPSTIEHYFTNISTALNYAHKYNCPLHPTYNVFEKTDFERTKVALTADEVSHIYHFDISKLNCRSDKKRTLEHVRDMFCLSCCLGQRYSDMLRLDPAMFDETKTVLRLHQQKTNSKAKVDITQFAFDKKMAMSILRKYDFRAPFTGCIANYEKYVHELMHLIGGEFLSLVRTENKVNGRISVIETPKWKCISSHTGRRSFITYNIMRGKTEAQVRECSGHRSSSSFARYVIFDE